MHIGCNYLLIFSASDLGVVDDWTDRMLVSHIG